jgi:phage terminase large subunit-like protein
VEGYIKFCERELVLTDGSPMVLTDPFKLWAEDLFGWFYYETRSFYEPYGDRPGGRYVKKRRLRRLCNKQVINLGRGGAKTVYASSVQGYGLTVDPETTHQFAVAFTMDQAEETLSPLRTAILKHPGPLFGFMTEGSLQNTTGNSANRPKLCSTKKGIENFLTGSLLETKPCSIDKLQGYRTKYNSLDEWRSTNIREDPVVAIEAGAAKTGDYIILLVSSEGTVRNRIGDTIGEELDNILKGDPDHPERLVAPQWSIWWYQLDDIKEVNQPEMWIKANPNLGKTVTYEVYELDKERAEIAPATRNDILAKRFGIPMEGYTYFFRYEETLVHDKRYSFRGMPCSVGADLSMGDDFCAFTFMFPTSYGEFGVKTRAYITDKTYYNLPPSLRNKYDEFKREDTLIVMEDRITLDMMEVYDDVDNHIMDMDYDVRAFGYDPYNATAFVDRWEKENGPFGIVKVPQGSRTESVPLGELKHMAEGRILLFDQLIMQYCMGNAITLEDTNGNRKLFKQRREDKIDCVAAMIDAYVAYKTIPDAFY